MEGIEGFEGLLLGNVLYYLICFYRFWYDPFVDFLFVNNYIILINNIVSIETNSL